MTGVVVPFTWDADLLPVGGQAVIEGVLMKGHSRWGLSVREPDGGIWRNSWAVSGWSKKTPWNWPVLRGVAVMAEMMRTGYRALNMSAEIALGEEEEKLSRTETALTLVLAILLVIGLFLLLPLWLSEVLGRIFSLSPAWAHALEGIMRGVVFMGYLALMGCWKDMRDVFAYHGAEHKTINAYENRIPLSPPEVMKCSRIHRRCGTSFLLVVIVVSIVVFGVAGSGGIAWRFASRIVLLPVVIGISYEIIRASSKSCTWGKWLIAPALLLQYLTTREPTEPQVEIAIDALNTALETNGIDALNTALETNTTTTQLDGE